MKKNLLLKFALSSSVLLFAISSQAFTFVNACVRSQSQIVISSVGDIMMHDPIQRHIYAYGFSNLISQVLPYMQAADINYGNLESPLADTLVGISGSAAKSDPGRVYDDYVHSDFPAFNAHSSIASEVAQIFDVVSTANNHSLDRGTKGADLTIDALNRAGLKYSGTIKRGQAEQWYTIVRAGSFNVAYISCTFGTNGIPDSGGQVFNCFRDKVQLLAYVKALRNAQGVDAVIVTPHWGDAEYTNTPDARNKTLGRQLIDAGATAVIGTHPHVIQPMERYVSQDGREGVIVYSTGNFISNQFFKDRAQTRMGLMVFLGLSKSRGQTWVNGVKYMPIWMQSGPYQVVPMRTSSSVPASMYTLASKLLDPGNEYIPGQRLVTNPECR